MIGSDQIVKPRGPKPNAKPIFKCAGDCGRMTRPTRVLLKNAPGTVTRKTKDMCAACDLKFAPARHRTIERTEPPEHKTKATLNSLDTFMAERRRRQSERMRKAGL